MRASDTTSIDLKYSKLNSSENCQYFKLLIRLMLDCIRLSVTAISKFVRNARLPCLNSDTCSIRYSHNNLLRFRGDLTAIACLKVSFRSTEHCLPGELEVGDCWIGLSQAEDSGLILSARVGKHTDELIEELVASTEGKTHCQEWDTDGWGGYERVLPPEVEHHIGKDRTQRLERTNGILRQQTGRWHRDSKQIW